MTTLNVPCPRCKTMDAIEMFKYIDICKICGWYRPIRRDTDETHQEQE